MKFYLYRIILNNLFSYFVTNSESRLVTSLPCHYVNSLPNNMSANSLSVSCQIAYAKGQAFLVTSNPWELVDRQDLKQL